MSPAGDRSLPGAASPVLCPQWRTAAVMQPYFFPYGGYFALIQAVDVFVLDDLARYTPKRWMNRNRIARPGGAGWQYITLPVQHGAQERPLCAVPLAAQPWQQRLWGKLTAYARAPYYRQTCALLQRWMQAVQQLPQPSLADANALGLQLVCEALGLVTPLVRLSTLSLPQYRPPYPKGQNALAVCRALGSVWEYRNLPGGAAFYPREPYRQAGIRLVFQQWGDLPPDGSPPLSILHLMMEHTPEEIRARLARVQLFE